MRYLSAVLVTGACLAFLFTSHCRAVPPAPGELATPLSAADLDAAALSEWVDGAETPIQPRKSGDREHSPQWVLWSRTTQPGHSGLAFGDSKTPGARHLRIGFAAPIAIGSVVVKGGGQLSYLKAGSADLGDLAKNEQWQPAERLKDDAISRDEVARGEYAVWVLPPGVATRALRFTHTAALADKDYSGWLGGAWISAQRLVNLAPQAMVSASSRNESAALLNNGSDDNLWRSWDNGRDGADQAISPEHPEWITLVWPRPVSIRSLATLWTGFGAADVQTYQGPSDRHPREGLPADWQTVATFDNLEHQFPRALGINWLDLRGEVTTRAVRLRITKVVGNALGNLTGKTHDGKRVWLGELVALQSLGTADLKSAVVPVEKAAAAPPPIAVHFTLKAPGYVTLVIEKPDGSRVRNLVSETYFPAGENVFPWDGADDLLRDKDAAAHGIYHIPARLVEPGAYRARGLVRKALDLRYEFSIYNAGTPAWSTADHTGGWLANHTPPSSALFVPGDHAPDGKPLMLLGSYVTEGGDGLAYVDLDGRKLGGQGWVGGNWTGAPFLARDAGPKAIPGYFAYAGAAWGEDSAAKNAPDKKGEIRITALTTTTAQGNKPIIKYTFVPKVDRSADLHEDTWSKQLGGIAVRDGILVFSLMDLNELVFVDVARKEVIAKVSIENPRGLAFDAQGRLLVLSRRALHHYAPPVISASFKLEAPQILVRDLEDPQQIVLGSDGAVFISDRGRSHQVKVFTADGKFVRAIGHPGAPAAGKYDPLHLNDPNGLAIDPQQRLWVAETNFQPKRVSVWSLDGKLLNSFYGPSEYGGGGKLDPQDKNRFYYHGMEFALDWQSGKSQVTRVFFRPEAQALPLPKRSGPPETPHYLKGQRYFSDSDNSNPTGGAAVCFVWIDRANVAVPVAAMGRANDWSVLQGPEFNSIWPAGLDPRGDASRNAAMFVWSDLNGDGLAQPNEVKIIKAKSGAITVLPDLSFAASRVDDLAIRYPPRSFTAQGAPVYDLASGETIVAGAQAPTSSGGDQVLLTNDGWGVLTVAPKPFAPQSMGGVFKGEPKWSYPSLWPGLHASHEAPTPDRPGELIGTTRLLGGFVTPRNSDAGPIWAINGNMGTIYLFTADGLFIATLFDDERRGESWAMPTAQPGMDLKRVTLSGENFWPSITQTSDGRIYLCDGARTSLVRIDGLESIQRIPESSIQVTPQDLQRAEASLAESEAARQKSHGQETLEVPILKSAPVVDGKLEDWAGAQWVDIDKSGVAAWFNSDSKPHNVTASLAVAGDRLYAAFRTDDDQLLRNSGEMATALFKTGGALDIMLAVNPGADPNRRQPVEGDLRLLVSQVQGKTVAVLYRAVVPGTKDPVPFSSPWRTITLDQVEDVSSRVELATSVTKNAKGKTDTACYELSIPLATLKLAPQPGMLLRGDLGILRGDGTKTVQRVYWSNKATAITADVPSEAELTPKLWGLLKFRQQQ